MTEHNERLLLEMEMNPALLQGSHREQWEAISDLDSFFKRVYNYFDERGLRCILAGRLISLGMLAFTIALSAYLAEAVNWDGLVNECVDESTCAGVKLLRDDSFRSPSPFLVLFLLVFSVYWLWMLLHFFWDLRALLEIRSFYRHKLNIDDSELLVVSWDTVVQRLVELQATARLCIVKDQLTAHDIANRILRKENFMVALVNQKLLPIEPLPGLRLSVMTKTLEWALEVCLLDAMFDGSGFRIRPSFTQDVRGLQRRLFACGALTLLLSPFIAAFMLLFFFLKHAEEFHRRPAASAFSRDYSLHARWCMREFNELPHLFEARVLASAADASAYVRQFPTPLLTLVARFVTFIVGSLAAVLIGLSLVNESVLVFYRISPDALFGEAAAPRQGFNLLWWLAVSSTILAISRAFSDPPNAPLHPEALLQSVARHTHYRPARWRGKGHTRAVYDEFVCLYQYRVWLLLQEILGCLTAPLVLCLALPARAEELLEFVRAFTVQVDGVGHVCGFALFDFERHGDTRYGAPVAGAPAHRSRDGKMEKSYLNFKLHHPSWRRDAGEVLIDRIAGPGSVAAVQQLAAAAASSSPDQLAAAQLAAAQLAAAAGSYTRDLASPLADGDEPPSQRRAAAGGAAGAEVGAATDYQPMGQSLPALEPGVGTAASAAFMRSSLGASGLMLLARSSVHADAGGRSGAAAGGFALGASFPGVPAGAVSSELQSEQLTSDLMGLLDQHFVAHSCGGGARGGGGAPAPFRAEEQPLRPPPPAQELELSSSHNVRGGAAGAEAGLPEAAPSEKEQPRHDEASPSSSSPDLASQADHQV